MRLRLACGLTSIVACSESGLATHQPDVFDATPSEAALPDATVEVSNLDGSAQDGSRACTRDDDCVFALAGPVCDLATGRCVACVPGNDRCPTGQYCDATTHSCRVGCRDDMACVGATGDGGVATQRCDPNTRRCVQCTNHDDCPLGNLCTDHGCVPGCSTARACPVGRSCCAGACVDLTNSASHCGACGAPCSIANGVGACREGMCAVGTCVGTFADCDRRVDNGCEVDTASDRAHCGACGAPCEPRPNGVATCAMGRCERRCAEGFADCDGDATNGCEVDLRSTVAHCGACNMACASGVCREGNCQAPRCDDRVRNGEESDVDCGGSGSCTRCPLGRRCSAGSDCASGECYGGVCGDLDGSSCATTGPVLGPRAGFSSVRVHARSALFRGVGSLVGDGMGTLWAHDPYGNGVSGDRVLRIDPDGSTVTVVAPPTFSTCTAQQIGRFSNGDLLLWNISSNTLVRITPSGAVSPFSTVSGIGGGGSCSDSGVQGVLVRADGTVVVTSPLRAQLITLRPDGSELRRTSGVPGAYRLAAAGEGLLVNSHGAILRFDADGTRSTLFDAPSVGLWANALRRDGMDDVYFASGTSVWAVDSEGRNLRLVLGCAGSPVSDVIMERATGGVGTSLYVSTLGRTIDADDGDTIWELRR